MEPKDIITSTAALVGMGLGIYNFFNARSADRVRLLVIPKASSYRGNDYAGRELYLQNRDAYDMNHPSPPETLSLEVVNLSKFAVVVKEVGLKPSWSRSRITLVTPIIKDGKPWPRKLEPRESLVVSFVAQKLLESKDIGLVREAYALTTCGATCCGRSGALRDFIRIAKSIA
jgi:hypothetical protein